MEFDFGMLEISRILTLPEADPREIVARLINVALEFVGIILLLMIIWGGVQFLFSLGNAEKMKRARATIFNAVIGAILIIVSWSIVRFVLTSIMNATGT